MITVEQALDKVLSYVNVLDQEEKAILESLGQVLAEDVYSTINIPPLDNSAMDGYAVIAEDTRGASAESPRGLQVIETVAAGSLPKNRLEKGQTIRIMTGAALPVGADTVVPFEDTDEEQRKGKSNEIGVLHETAPDCNIRRAGEDIAKGSLVLRKGTIVRPSEIGVLASVGKSCAKVIRRPVIAILATGNEVVDINQPLEPGKIYNSNSYSITAQVLRYGGIPKMLGIALDSEESLVSKLQQARGADMLITIGGVSMGDYDMVKNVLDKEGEILFWTVRMKPGKPLAFGRIQGIPHLGFPGNPVSSMITFELFARPAILKMLGKKNLSKPTIEAILEDSIVNRDGRRIFARAIVERRNGTFHARLTGPQGSGILTSMALANGLAIVPEDKKAIKAGETVSVMMLDWSEEA